ncbi:MAG: hypothetical protein ABIH38_02440 [Patescibacteria group bacterium]
MSSSNIYELAERWEEKPLFLQIFVHLVLCPLLTLILAFGCAAYCWYAKAVTRLISGKEKVMVFSGYTLGKVRKRTDDFLGNLLGIVLLLITPTFYLGRYQPPVLAVINIILFFVLGFHWWLIPTLIYFLLGWVFAYYLSQPEE